MLKDVFVVLSAFAIASYANNVTEVKVELNLSNLGDQLNHRVLQLLIQAYMTDVPDKIAFLQDQLKEENCTTDWNVTITENKLPQINGVYGTFRVGDNVIDVVGRNSTLAQRALDFDIYDPSE